MSINLVTLPYFISGSNGFFLESKKGEPYVEVFQAIRLEHIVVDYCSVEVLEADKIIPSSEWVKGEVATLMCFVLRLAPASLPSTVAENTTSGPAT